MSIATTTAKKHIVFLHPDLGIGGAERLVIDAAVGLQDLGHKVTIFTSHCDPGHCFDEARDGTLDVRVRGNAIVPSVILGRFSILCAILRQLHLLLQICVLTSELRELHPSAFFVDQLSACVPFLRSLYPNARVLFYCHFPDKLLADRRGVAKKLYRIPFDAFEGLTTGASDVIVVNSNFTRSVFADAFPLLRGIRPKVVYPCVDVGVSDDHSKHGQSQQRLWSDKKILLSINRFERKKDVGLAIRAFSRLGQSHRQSARLVIAGGYDARVAENVAYLQDLDLLAVALGLRTATITSQDNAAAADANVDVVFMPSVSSNTKSALLKSATLLLYTPNFEHFGIVPLEAMLAGVPVLAAATGGPTESIVDDITGWLRPTDDIGSWTRVMVEVLSSGDEARLEAMGKAGNERVKREFSKERMAARLDYTFHEVCGRKRTALVEWWDVTMVVGGLIALALSLWLIFRRS